MKEKAYFRRHGTTQEKALEVWKKIGGIGPMPVPGFWNVENKAYFSIRALGPDKEFSLLGHHGLRYTPKKGLMPVGIACTPYGEINVYKTADVIEYKKRSEERKTKHPARIFDFDPETIVACLVVVNRYARKLARLVPDYYSYRMHGFCHHRKDERDRLYDLKHNTLIRIAHNATARQWHYSQNGWLLYMTFSTGSGREYGFHLPCEPDSSILPDRNSVPYVESVPTVDSPRFKVHGKTLRLKDAIATLSAFIEKTEVPECNREIEKWHDDSQELYYKRNSRFASRWSELDEDDNWDDDYDDDEWDN